MSTRVDARQRNRVAKAISLTPEIKQNTLVTFLAVALLLSCSPKVLEGLETSLSPEILQRFKRIDPNFNAKACLQELSDLGVSSVTELVLKQAWRYIEVSKEHESLCSRKEAFEVLLEKEKCEVERLLAKLAANERRMEDYLRRILALEKELQSAKDDSRFKGNGPHEGSAGLGPNDGSVSEWKRIAEECQSRLKEREVRNEEDVLSLEQKVADLRKQLENWEASYQQSRDSRTVNGVDLLHTPMDQPLPLAVALEESNPHQERGELVCNTPLSRIMTRQLPLTDPLFAIEVESNIINNPPLPLAVAQESGMDQETAQLVLNTPYRPRRRIEDGEMVCGALGERGRVLLENILPLPVQASTHFGGHRDELVCPPLPRNGGAEMWLRHAEIVCGSVVTSPLSYEEQSEVVCGGVGWGRTAQSLPHQTSNSTMYSSVVWNNLGAIGTLQNTTHHYIPQLLRETTTPNTPVAVNAHFSYECHSLEECRPKSGIPREAVGDPPPTQQLVTGRMT